MTTTSEHTTSRKKLFNPNEHLMQIKSGGKDGLKDYLPVQWRIAWFREACPQGTIETEMLHLDLDRETEEDYYGYNSESRRNEKMTRRANGFVIFRAVVKDGKGGIATGTKSEKAASFADYIEKAETGAIGRALAALGFGTQFAPELSEEHRIVDAPVDRPKTPTTTNADPGQKTSEQPPATTTIPMISQRDLRWARRMLDDDPTRIQGVCDYYHVQRLEDLTNAQAMNLINRLSSQAKQGSKAPAASNHPPA